MSSKSLLESMTAQIFNNGVNPYKMDTKYFQHTYDLHIGLGMKSHCNLGKRAADTRNRHKYIFKQPV